jgi:hypothetical protein
MASLEDKTTVLTLITETSKLLKRLANNKFIEEYAKDQMRNIINREFTCEETLTKINGIYCTELNHKLSFGQVKEYIYAKPHSGLYYDKIHDQFLINISGVVLYGNVGNLVSKKSKKCFKCNNDCDKEECKYYHGADICFVRGKHPADMPHLHQKNTQDYLIRRVMHDLLTLLSISNSRT